jgi:hypothetical protein
MLEEVARLKLRPNVPCETACLFGRDQTSSYIKARATWAAELADIQTVQAAHKPLGHYLDIQQLLQCGPSHDPHLVHRYIPILMLRLNRVDECYEWIRKWAIASVRSLYFNEPSDVYEDLNIADV